MAPRGRQMTDQLQSTYETYSEYNQRVRGWLIIFGVGVPGVTISNEWLREKLLISEHGDDIVALFFIGVFLQIFLALLNKYINWHTHDYTAKGIKDEDTGKIFLFFYGAIWIDKLIDGATLTAYGLGLWLIYYATFLY